MMDRHLAADRADGKQLPALLTPATEHRVLQNAYLQVRELAACNAARTRGDEQRRQVADEHHQKRAAVPAESCAIKAFCLKIVLRPLVEFSLAYPHSFVLSCKSHYHSFPLAKHFSDFMQINYNKNKFLCKWIAADSRGIFGGMRKNLRSYDLFQQFPNPRKKRNNAQALSFRIVSNF